MEPGDELDKAIDTALERTKDAQGRVGDAIEQGLPAAGHATTVAHRADDLSELADDAATAARAGRERDEGLREGVES
jgi:hypothetical protein